MATMMCLPSSHILRSFRVQLSNGRPGGVADLYKGCLNLQAPHHYRRKPPPSPGSSRLYLRYQYTIWPKRSPSNAARPRKIRPQQSRLPKSNVARQGPVIGVDTKSLRFVLHSAMANSQATAFPMATNNRGSATVLGTVSRA